MSLVTNGPGKFLLLYEGVMGPLVTYRCRFSMSRIYNGIVRQRPQLLFDTVHQRRMIPTREVSPANTFPEQNVPPDDKTLFFGIKAHATRRMTRKKQDGQPIFANAHPLARGQKDVFPPII